MKKNFKKQLERYEKEHPNPMRGGLTTSDVLEIISLAEEVDGGSIVNVADIAWRAGYGAGMDHEARKRRSAGKGAKE